jgi:hypothetical protein
MQVRGLNFNKGEGRGNIESADEMFMALWKVYFM